MNVAVTGAGGRMGEAVMAAAAEREDLTLAWGIANDPGDGKAHGASVYGPNELEHNLDRYRPNVLVDFTLPDASVEVVTAAAEAAVPVVVGTTGFSDEQMDELRAASESVPVLKATNFARGVQALLRAVESAVSDLPGYDVEVTETHHNRKRDAPSGTANTILEAITEHRDLEPVYGREGVQPRAEDEVGVLVSRLGDVRGEHEVRLGDNDEVLTIAHRAEDRAVFAAGALDAAGWLATQNPGWYTFGAVIDAT